MHIVTFRKHTGDAEDFPFVCSVKIILWFLNHKPWSRAGALLAVLHNLPPAHKFPLMRLLPMVELIRPPVYSPVGKQQSR